MSNHLRQVWAQRIEGVIPPGWERYVEHERQQEDVTRTADLWLPTQAVEHYREYERSGENLEALDEAIEGVGVRVPLWIQTDGTVAVLSEGNHRLTLAQRHGWSKLPVRVTRVSRVINGVPLEPILADWVETHTLRKLESKEAGPCSGIIPDRVKWKGPVNTHAPKPVVLDPMAKRDLQRIYPDEQKKVRQAIQQLEAGTAPLESKHRDELVGTFGIRIDPDCRLLVYPHTDGAWHVFYIGHHDYDEAERRMSAPRAAVLTGLAEKARQTGTLDAFKLIHEVALGLDELGSVADALDLDRVTDAMVQRAHREIIQDSQAAMVRVGMTEQFTVYRKGPLAGVVSVSTMPLTTFRDPVKYLVHRSDILTFGEGLLRGTFAEDELHVEASKLRPERTAAAGSGFTFTIEKNVPMRGVTRGGRRLVARRDGKRVGEIVYKEIATMSAHLGGIRAFVKGEGVATALLDRFRQMYPYWSATPWTDEGAAFWAAYKRHHPDAKDPSIGFVS